jgi:hypothetical protein
VGNTEHDIVGEYITEESEPRRMEPRRMEPRRMVLKFSCLSGSQES